MKASEKFCIFLDLSKLYGLKIVEASHIVLCSRFLTRDFAKYNFVNSSQSLEISAFFIWTEVEDILAKSLGRQGLHKGDRGK